MASHERESLLPSELFQDDHDVFSEDNNNNNNNSNNNNNNNITVSPKGLRSFESNFGSCGSSYSSWSDFSSPLSWELGSTSETSTTEGEDDQELFISELSRQMAENMLQDDDDDDDEAEIQHHESITAVPENPETSDSVKWSESKSSSVCYYNSQELMSKSENLTSDQVSKEDRLRQVQVYQLKNQPQVRKQQGFGYGGRRVKSTDQSIQQQVQHKEHQNMMQNNKGKTRRYGPGKKSSVPHVPSPPPGGSGMRAVFLGSGSERKVSAGTGVFLPSGTYPTPELKRKSGCSTVLVPARVLQTLQQQFNAVGELSSSHTSPATHPWQNDVLARINGLLSQEKEHVEFQTRPASASASSSSSAGATAETSHQQDLHLPQEWTY